MPIPVYQSLLSAIDFDSTDIVLALGDFNTRLGSFTGDTRSTNPRSNFFLNWLTVNQVQLWNKILTPGQVTYESNTGNSIIDFFISKSNVFSTTPELSIESEINFNSDHHLLKFNVAVDLQPPPQPSSSQRRRIWKLQRLNEKEINTLYKRLFFINILPLHQELKYYIRNQVQNHLQLYQEGSTVDDFNIHVRKQQLEENINISNNFNFSVTNESPQSFIDKLGTKLEDAITNALDNSVTVATPQQKDWKFFWNSTLQHMAELRQDAYQQWRRSRQGNTSVEVIAEHWSHYQESSSTFKKQLKKEKRFHWKKFCSDIQDKPHNDVYPILKRIKSKHSTTVNFSHIDGPQAAADTMADHLRNVYGGDQDDLSSWRSSRLPLYKNVATPSFLTPRAIKNVLNSMATKKAPGKDHITKEMLTAIWYPLCNFLSDFFTLCYTWAWTPANYRSALVVPIFKK
ncbi:hypothetical protein ABG067_007781, partial [Albugo candida]